MRTRTCAIGLQLTTLALIAVALHLANHADEYQVPSMDSKVEISDLYIQLRRDPEGRLARTQSAYPIVLRTDGLEGPAYVLYPRIEYHRLAPRILGQSLCRVRGSLAIEVVSNTGLGASHFLSASDQLSWLAEHRSEVELFIDQEGWSPAMGELVVSQQERLSSYWALGMLATLVLAGVFQGVATLLWVLLLVALRRRARRRRANLCSECGYPTLGQCPECGYVSGKDTVGTTDCQT